MLRLILTVGLGVITLSGAHSQLRKFYSLKEEDKFDTVKLTLEATSSTCFIRTAQNSNPLNIYGDPDLQKINPSYHANIKGKTCDVNLKLEEYKTTALGDGFSFSTLFAGNSSENTKDYWKVYLSDTKVYDLNMNYGIGDANLDFSGAAISKMKVNTGSANVKAGFMNGQPNKIEMDTFHVKVDLGSFIGPNMNLTKATTVIAEIGFGNAKLDFREGMNKKCNIQTTVGAGNLDILLPKDEIPIIIYVEDSPLCGIRLTKDFEEVEDNVFVNMNYSANAENLMTFNVDVALGNITFHR